MTYLFRSGFGKIPVYDLARPGLADLRFDTIKGYADLAKRYAQIGDPEAAVELLDTIEQVSRDTRDFLTTFLKPKSEQ